MNNDHEETMIVANGFTGIDVDKMDYFAQDARSVGLPNSFDWRRFTQTAKIICVKDERNEEFRHICSRDKDAPSLYEMFHTRTLLYRSVYRHKTVIIVEDLMKEALRKANHVIRVNGYPLLECWKNVDAFLTLNDTIEDYILQLSDEKLSPPLPPPNAPATELFDAKKIFARITERQLPKFVGRTGNESNDHKKLACDFVRDKGLEINESYLKSKEAIFNFGKRGEDPIMSHYFYYKENPGIMPKPYKFKKEEVSSLLPHQLDETQLLWYYDVTEHDKECTSNDEAKTGSAIMEILLKYFTSEANK
uniref:Uncharacterized protein n=1 Tax=Amphimedon queenslandica TaxID=400682 RepID=A0A1X7TTY9_AMPQE